MSNVLQKASGLLSSTKLFAAYQWAIGAPRCHRRFIQEFARPRSSDRVLDIGCGFGASVNYLAGTRDYVGVDISAEYIAAARRRFGNRGTFICSAIEDIEAASIGEFDLAISFGVIHHLDDSSVRSMLRLASQVVHRGGRLVSIDPCRVSEQSALARFLVNNDRGQFVRDSEGYRTLCQPYGRTDVRLVSDMLRIPYPQAITIVEF